MYEAFIFLRIFQEQFKIYDNILFQRQIDLDFVFLSYIYIYTEKIINTFVKS